MGHRVTLEARARGAIIRPLGDTIVIMPPLAIEADQLEQLVRATAAAIAVATSDELARRLERAHDATRTELSERSGMPGGERCGGIGRTAIPAPPGGARRREVRSDQSSYGVKSFFRAPQTGQNHVSGMSSNAVPAGMPPSGSPSAGS